MDVDDKSTLLCHLISSFFIKILKKIYDLTSASPFIKLKDYFTTTIKSSRLLVTNTPTCLG